MKKKAITIIAGKETYINLRRFDTIKELNDTVRTYKEKFAEKLNKNQLAVLNHLHSYSAKFFGVSFRSKNKIANTLGISRRTVIRACQHLESLGIIKQLEMKRESDKRQTSNAIVIQPIIVEEKQVVTQEAVKNEENCHTNKTNSISLKQNILNKRNTISNSEIVGNSVDNFKQAEFVSHWVPDRFVSLVKSYYSEAKTIQEFWKVVRQCNSIVNFETGQKAFTKDQELTIGLKAIKEFVMKVKAGVKMSKGKFAYFNGIVNNLMDKFYFDREFMEA